MIVAAHYEPSVGMHLILQGTIEGMTVFLPEAMTIAAIENHLRELEEWLG